MKTVSRQGLGQALFAAWRYHYDGVQRLAVNDEFVSWEHPLSEKDSIAFLPPMSGG